MYVRTEKSARQKIREIAEDTSCKSMAGKSIAGGSVVGSASSITGWALAKSYGLSSAVAMTNALKFGLFGCGVGSIACCLLCGGIACACKSCENEEENRRLLEY